MARALFSILLCLLLPAPAAAFCGFYVAGSDAELTNDATQVVLMRYGTRTVVSMQNAYTGPPEDFALVVPVPQVLKKRNVRTLDADVFGRIDTLTSPRLVEYWEQDPCPRDGSVFDFDDVELDGALASPTSVGLYRKSKASPVKVEARFSVAEYDIVVLSAKESTALEAWLLENEYRIPDGAGPYLRPYVESGMYFFVARVNAKRVQRSAQGRVVLSPLRFDYDHDGFFLPVRLGMINAAENQDLVVYTLGYQRRFEVANRPNVFVPTNLEVRDEVRDDFTAYYEAVFARTLEQEPAAVVTEYAWGSQKCDPCPGPTLSQADILSLGGDLMPDSLNAWSWVVTRMHARYSADEVGEDLVFTHAPPVVGGREVRQADGALEQGARQDRENNFQARYIIRHEWAGDASCDNPRFGVWGGPPDGTSGRVVGAPSANTRGEAPMTEVSFDVDALTKGSFPIGRVRAAREVMPPRGRSVGATGAGCASVDARSPGALAVLVFAAAWRRRRR